MAACFLTCLFLSTQYKMDNNRLTIRYYSFCILTSEPLKGSTTSQNICAGSQNRFVVTGFAPASNLETVEMTICAADLLSHTSTQKSVLSGAYDARRQRFFRKTKKVGPSTPQVARKFFPSAINYLSLIIVPRWNMVIKREYRREYEYLYSRFFIQLVPASSKLDKLYSTRPTPALLSNGWQPKANSSDTMLRPTTLGFMRIFSNFNFLQFYKNNCV